MYKCNWQWQQLQKLLKHAYEHTEFYKKAWKEVGIESHEDISSMAAFEQLPIITKSDIREHYQSFQSDKHLDNVKKATGGSSGQPFSFELDLNSNTRREAVMWRGYGWLGAGLGVKTLYLWGADLGNPSKSKTLKNALYHGFYNRKMLNSFEMNNRYLDVCKSNNIVILLRYKSFVIFIICISRIIPFVQTFNETINIHPI